MAAYNKFNSFVEALAEKVHNLQSDVLKVALTNTLPTAANAVLADIAQISYTNLSSRTLTETTSAQVAGVYSLILSNLTLTSSGGSTGPFQYVVVYNDTATNKELICWFDRGSVITLADTETLTLTMGANLLQIA